MLTRYITILKANKSEAQKFFGPFVSENTAYQFADNQQYDKTNGGYVKVRPIYTPDMSHLGTRPHALA